MAKKTRSRTQKKSTPLDVNEFSGFRRLIHTEKDLTKGVSKTRPKLRPSSVESIVSALAKNSIYRNAIAQDAFPKAYEDIRSGRRFSRCDDRIELLWAAHTISKFSTEINEFLKIKNNFHSKLLKSEYSNAKFHLDEIERLFGKSIWLLSTSITMRHFLGGLNEQKAYLREVVDTPGISSFVAYIAYLFSYSIEDGVTIDDIRSNFFKNDDDDLEEFYTYVAYHIDPFSMGSIRRPLDCIWMENESPIIDRYETLVEMIQILSARGELLDEVRQCVTALAQVDDVRIQNLAFIYGVAELTAPVDADFILACDLYSRGDYESARSKLYDIKRSRPESAWIYEIIARTNSFTKDESNDDTFAGNLI